nr:hypothetical protein [Candidatus Freyarchaeota archaeon]
MRKLNLKRFFKQKYLIFLLIPVFILLGPIYVPIYISSQNSSNNLKNLIIVKGIIQAQSMFTPSSPNPLIYMMDLTTIVTLGVADWGFGTKREAEVNEGEVDLASWSTLTSTESQCVYCSCQVTVGVNFCPLCSKAIAICSVFNRCILSGEVFVGYSYCQFLRLRNHLLE